MLSSTELSGGAVDTDDGLRPTFTRRRLASLHEVVPGWDRKSISKGDHVRGGRAGPGDLHAVLRGLAAEVAATARREQLWFGRDTEDPLRRLQETHTPHKLAVPTHDERVILRVWLFLHGKLPSKPVRLIGVGISDWQQRTRASAERPFEPQEKEKRRSPTANSTVLRIDSEGKLQCGGATKSDKRKPG